MLCETDIIARDGDKATIGHLTVRCIGAPGHNAGLTINEVEMGRESVWFCGDLIEVGQARQSLELGWAGDPACNRPT